MEHPKEEIEVCISANDWKTSQGDFQAALVRALSRKTKTQWRVICANIMVECTEPYRTLVVQSAVLETLREQQISFQQQPEAEVICPEISYVKADMHMPLIADEHSHIMFKRSAHFLSK